MPREKLFDERRCLVVMMLQWVEIFLLVTARLGYNIWRFRRATIAQIAWTHFSAKACCSFEVAFDLFPYPI